jgi:NADPH-dependent curcumin reductase CurA
MQNDIPTAANRQWILANRPKGEPTPANFRFVEGPVPDALGDGDVLVRNRFLSLDPYMRWRMNDAKSYAAPVAIDEVMVGATIGTVIRSEDSSFVPGDIVLGGGGWQDYFISRATKLRKLDDTVSPLSAHMGILGSPGFTAYAGLMKIGQPKAGETVVVGAATGPVGSMVGQLAKLQGCRAVAIAGGPDKCTFAVRELGFDAAIDHRDPAFAERLQEACPEGIDVYFENIGGAVFDAVQPLLNNFARIPVCGLVASYNEDPAKSEQGGLALFMRETLVKRLTVRGFIVTDFLAAQPEFLEMAAPLFAAGKLVYQEDVVVGLENAPEAFIGLLKGQNFGKLIIKLD